MIRKRIIREMLKRPDLLYNGKPSPTKLQRLTGIRLTSLHDYLRGGKTLHEDSLNKILKVLNLKIVKK